MAGFVINDGTHRAGRPRHHPDDGRSTGNFTQSARRHLRRRRRRRGSDFGPDHRLAALPISPARSPSTCSACRSTAAQSYHDPAGPERRHRQRPRPHRQPGAARHADVPDRQRRRARHRRRLRGRSASIPTRRRSRDNLDQIFRAGVGGVGPVLLGLLNVDSIDEYKNALDQLSPELYSDAEIAALYSSLAFSNSLLELQGQRHRHRLDHPRGPVPVGRRQRALPRHRHDQRPDRLQRDGRAVHRRRAGGARRRVAARLRRPATSRARCRRRPARRAKARWRRAACRSSTIPARCCSPAR